LLLAHASQTNRRGLKGNEGPILRRSFIYQYSKIYKLNEVGWQGLSSLKGAITQAAIGSNACSYITGGQGDRSNEVHYV